MLSTSLLRAQMTRFGEGSDATRSSIANCFGRVPSVSCRAKTTANCEKRRSCSYSHGERYHLHLKPAPTTVILSVNC